MRLLDMEAACDLVTEHCRFSTVEPKVLPFSGGPESLPGPTGKITRIDSCESVCEVRDAYGHLVLGLHCCGDGHLPGLVLNPKPYMGGVHNWGAPI